MNLSTIFLPKREAFVDRLIRAANAERVVASLPDKPRYWLARRRTSGFGHVPHLLNPKQGDDYELVSSAMQKCIFVHVPKTAGISVAHALFGSRAGGHLPLSYYLWLYGAQKFDQYFKFAFVRHPIDRAQSAYQFLFQGGLSQVDRSWADLHVKPYKTFDEFVSKSLIRPEVHQGLHFRPQVYFLIDPRTEKLGLDYLGTTENIKQDFDVIAGRVAGRTSLEFLNRSSEPKVPLEITRKSSDTLREIYAADFSNLGYREHAS